jgi:uncharacterized membrane protein
MNRKQLRHILIAHIPIPAVTLLMGFTAFFSGKLWFLVDIQLDFPFNYAFLISCFAYVGITIIEGKRHYQELGRSEPVWNPKEEAEKERLKGI